MFGAPKPVSAEEYSKIYQLTGIDIDGRRDLVEHMIPRLENNMRQWIAFVKAVPGFQCLPLEDQIALIKSKFVLKYPSVHLKIGGAVVAYWLACWTQDSRGVCSIPTQGKVRI